MIRVVQQGKFGEVWVGVSTLGNLRIQEDQNAAVVAALVAAETNTIIKSSSGVAFAAPDASKPDTVTFTGRKVYSFRANSKHSCKVVLDGIQLLDNIAARGLPATGWF